jgi:hypothetical protein
MRYSSLLSVDMVLVDGRSRSSVLAPVINQCLMALSDHLNYHIVVLCGSERQAEEIDRLGDQCGQELYFHGEPCPSVEDVSALVKAAKLIILPVRSTKRSWVVGDGGEILCPTVLVGRDETLYYPNGQRSTDILHATVMECLISLPQAP